VATTLQQEGEIRFRRTVEGEITEEVTVEIEDYPFASTRDRVTFWQGDACNLKPHFTGYDLIIANNLIDRLYEPRLFFDGIESRLASGGTLIIASPYTWQESSTKKAHWLGGYYDTEGDPRFTLDTLWTLLSAHFELIDQRDVPFVIRETARKFQHTISEVTVWRLRS
jgi:putative 4-mercaptohistidine N1-methyltranferase